jgi:hypothetical protein
MYIGKVHLAVGGRFNVRIPYYATPKTPAPAANTICYCHQCVSPNVVNTQFIQFILFIHNQN